MVEVSVSIVNTNNKMYLEECLNSLYSIKTRMEFETLVVDNASTDGSVEMIKGKFPDVKLKINDGKLSYAKNNNINIERARGEFILFLNEDIIVKTNIVDIMAFYLKEHPEVGVVGGKTLNPDGSLQISCARKLPCLLYEFYDMSLLSKIFPKNKILGATKDKIMTLCRGIDTNLFISDKNLNNRENIIISTRSLKPVYNIECLIKSLPSILEKRKNVKCLIAGDGVLRGKLENLSAELGVRDFIEFHGQLSIEKIAELLKNSLIYISPTFSDGVSPSLLEAMACGVFPIVSDIPPNKEWIKDGKNGFLFPPNNPEILANKVLEAFENQILREKTMELNRKIVEQRADINKNMKIFSAVFNELIRRKNNCSQRIK